jgi:hypothetical protein
MRIAALRTGQGKAKTSKRRREPHRGLKPYARTKATAAKPVAVSAVITGKVGFLGIASRRR